MQKKAPETTKPAPAEIDCAQYRIANPEEFSPTILNRMEAGGRVLGGVLERSNGNGAYSFSSEITEATKLFGEVAQHWLADPGKAGATQSALMRDYLQLAGATAQRMAGTGAPPVVTPEPGDNRVNDPEWSRNP